MLTIAAPAGAEKIENLEVDQIYPLLDFINVMTYDLNGAWSPVSNFNAPLYPSPEDPTSPPGDTAHGAIQNYLGEGVPAQKLVLGVPFYGRGVDGVASQNQGLFQPFTGIPLGTWDTAGGSATGMFDYADLALHYLGQPGVVAYRDEVSGVPWLHDSARGLFISYDDPLSLALKKEYVLSNGLGGVMIWEMSSDLDDQLIDALVSGDPPPAVPGLSPGSLALLGLLLGGVGLSSSALGQALRS